MKQPSPPMGIEPIEEMQPAPLPSRPHQILRGIRMTVRGRSVTLRGLRSEPKGMLRWLLVLGPGLIAASAGNDAGGIITYSSAGAQFGYHLIWVMVIITLSLAVVQETVARLGAASGQGLLELIRERFGIGWSMLAVGTILTANGVLLVSEFVGVGAAAEILGVSKYIAVPIAAVLLWILVIYASYSRVEKLFLVMTLVFFAYPAAAILAKPDWLSVIKGAFVPTIHLDKNYILLLVGLIGTTITPYMQLYQQSSVVERGIARRHYWPERLDTYFGALFSNVMSIAMMIATAATIYIAGPRQLESAADAAKALVPAVGQAAVILFAIGMMGASMLAAAVLPLATAYGVSEALGLPKGVNLDFRRARLFFGLFTAMLVIGAISALIPGLPIIRWFLFAQVLNGVLFPVMLIFILILINDKRIAGSLKNSLFNNIVGWGTFFLIATAVVVMIISQIFF